MLLFIVFLIVLVALYVMTSGSMGQSVVMSFKSLSDFFLVGLEDIKELEEEVVDEIAGVTG